MAGILAGGRSTRMGCPKALLKRNDGTTLIEHTASVAGQVADEVVLCGSPPAELPSSLQSIRVLPDPIAGGGPLAGLCALLEHAGERWVLLIACDMPLLGVEVLQRLQAEARPDVDAVCFERLERPGNYHACCALYHPRLHSAALAELMAGRGSMQRFLSGVRKVALQPIALYGRQLMNVNTPADLNAIPEMIS